MSPVAGPHLTERALYEIGVEMGYIDPPTIPEGMTCSEYRLSRVRRRTWLRRVWRRLHGHG